MTERLFDLNNANADIMVVPQQEGGAEGDNYFGSIGDATMKHVQELSGFGRQMWQELLLMPSGDLYRMTPSWEDNDRDPNNLRGKDLKKYAARFRGKVSDSMMAVIDEAIENEIERRERDEPELIGDPEDAMNQEIIPYEDWEKFPGHWSKMDIPSTPRDRALYMGTTRQLCYDEFPVGHPEEHIISQFLGMMNRRWEDGLDEGYAGWVEGVLDSTPMKSYVRETLRRLVYQIAQNNNGADKYVATALAHIDACYAIEYKNKVAKKAMRNPITQLLIKKEKEWEQMAESGFTVYGIIKQFGSLLFNEFRDQMTGWHWARYRRIRDKHAPRVILKGVDINRCSLQQLQKTLRVDVNEAKKVWFARPFMGLEDGYDSGNLSPISFADDEKTDKVVLFLEKHGKIAEEHKDPARMRDVCNILMKMQKEKHGDINSSQWGTIWRYYKILKARVLDAVKEAQSDTKNIHG